MFYTAIKGAKGGVIIRSGGEEGGIQGGSKIDARSINSATLTSLIARPSDFSFRGRCFIGGGGGERGGKAGFWKEGKDRNCSSRCRSSTCCARRCRRRRSLTDFLMFKKVLKKKRKKRDRGEEMV